MSRRPVLATLLVLMVAACGGEDEPSGRSLRRDGAASSRDAGSATIDAGTEPGEDAGAPTDARLPPQGPEQSGEATYYDAEGVGACGIPFPPDYLLAAINDEQYTKENCGRCVSVKGPKGTVVVRILDKCPGCNEGDLDLSITAFTKIADKVDGRVKITWHFVDCPF